MNKLKLYLALLTLVFSINPAKAQNGIVLVELFTSQGCSSCPRADELLVDLVESGDPQIIALSYHVDYWNRLGWKDPYSSVESTQRQYDYARSLQASTVYTPQMVVNGTSEFVGSNKAVASREINEAKKSAVFEADLIELRDISSGYVTIAFRKRLAGKGDLVLSIALVEKGLSTQVKRGENGGRFLRHENVVRVLQTTAYQEGMLKLKIPGDSKRQNLSVVAILQSQKTMEVHAVEMESINQLN